MHSSSAPVRGFPVARAPALVLCALGALGACGQGSGLPDPVEVAAPAPSPVRVRAPGRGNFSLRVLRDDALRLQSHRGDGPARAPLAFGVTAAFAPTHFYDPEAPEKERDVVWHGAGEVRAGRVTASETTLEVALVPGPGRAIVRLSPGDADGLKLEVSAEGVSGVVVFTRLGFTAPDGPLWGGGESFLGADGRGRAWPMQMRADGTFRSATNERHVPIPFLTDKRGAAVLVDEPRSGVFDNARTTPGRIELTFAASSLRAHLLASASAPGAVEALARLTGLPRLPPHWAFAPQQWRNEHRDMAQVFEDARAMRENGIPGGVIWIDNPWQTGFSTFTFIPPKYPDARNALAALGRMGYRVILWTVPYLNNSDDSGVRPGMTRESQALFESARAQNLLVHFDSTHTPLVLPWSFGSGAALDFSTSAGRDFFTTLATRATLLGTHGWKLDYGEETVPELLGSRLGLRFNNGETEETMHNRQSIGFHQAARAAFAQPDDAFLIGRASALGGQAEIDAIWPGDLEADFTLGDVATRNVGGLRAALSGALSLALSGFPTFGSDIGGYRGGDATEELLLRWAAMQATLPIMQLGGGGAPHTPWLPPYSSTALARYKTLARLHLDLFPYLYGLAKRASMSGTPYLLPPAAGAPDSPALDAVDDAFFVGEHLYAAPVLDAGAAGRRVVLPPGEWIAVGETLGGRTRHAGGSTLDVTAAPGELPLFLRVGRALPLGAPDTVTLSPASEPGVVSSGKWDGRLRVLWAPDFAQTGAPPPSTFTLGVPATLETAGGTLRVTGSATAPLRRLVVELALSTAPSRAEVTRGAETTATVVPPDADADVWTCTLCARWEAAGTFRVGMSLADGAAPVSVRVAP